MLLLMYPQTDTFLFRAIVEIDWMSMISAYMSSCLYYFVTFGMS